VTDHLIRRARSGDEAALRSLYETHRPRVMRLAFGLLGDADEAEDVMQDVLVYALTHLERYDADRAAFGTWLHTIAVSRCRDRARRRAFGVKRVTDWFRSHPPVGSADREAIVDRLDITSEVDRALAMLTLKQREALVLREIEGLSYKEMGEVLGVPMRTAQTRVTAAYAALRNTLDRQDSMPSVGEPEMDVG